MNDLQSLKILVIVNPGSGTNDTDWKKVIGDYFQNSRHSLDWIMLSKETKQEEISKRIRETNPDKVVAVGGDGTVKIAAQSLLKTKIPLGIIPAGSANGLAKELNIPVNTTKALDLIVDGALKEIHVTNVNDEICIHLSDIGFNAFVIKKFDTGAQRGMLGYVKAAWKVLWQHPKMNLHMKIDGQTVYRRAAMIVIANATKYGSGAQINPDGKLDDEVFEAVVVKEVSFAEIFKMTVTHMPYDETKTEVFQVRSLEIHSRRKAHFQVDGEYLGKIHSVVATIVPAALTIIVPAGS